MTDEPRRVLRWVVPIDDESHAIGSGPVIMVAARSNVPHPSPVHAVEVWTIDHIVDRNTRRVRVFGTGHPLPDHAVHVGSTFDAATDRLVWHVFEVGS